MAIWSSEIKELERLHESFKGQLPYLERELGRLIKADDENMILLYSRRCLEVIITDLCECELKRPRKTEPLKGIIDKLQKEEKVPSHIITSMHGLNELSTYGAHPKDFDPEQVKPVLVNLDIIIKWYLKYKQILTIGNANIEKEKVQLMKEHPEEVEIEKRKVVHRESGNLNRNKLLSGAVVLAILIIATILLYPKIFKQSTLEKLRSPGERIALAVMPFQNMTNDSTWNVWQDGIQNELITSLTNSEELTVRQTETINSLIQGKSLTNYASITPSVASNISRKLDANVLIYGSIKEVDKTIRINAQLIDAKTKASYKSFQIDGTTENILHMVDSLSVIVKNFLIITILGKKGPTAFPNQFVSSTNYPEAYRYFMYGQTAYYKNDYSTAIDWFLQALAIDSNLIGAMAKISTAYYNEYDVSKYEQGKEWCLRYYKKLDMMTMQQKIWANIIYTFYFKTPNERINYIKQLIDIDDHQPITYFQLGDCYLEMFQYDKAIPEFEKALEMFHKWKTKPFWVAFYQEFGQALHGAGNYREEKKLYRKAEKDFPDAPELLEQQALLSLTEGDTVEANEYIEKWISIRKEQSWSEQDILTGLTWIYRLAGVLDKTEECFRKALLLEPKNEVRINRLAYFLIDKDLNIKEGMELVDKALSLSPDHYEYLHTKGWGLYKLGKYKEALELLEKSWDLRMKNAIYDHEAFLHLEAAKKAVASQKRTDR